ncbi:MAG: hypothetical protein JRG91_01265 [Deltaproteobacteria bacterium]|nr:hypothetical protein [Deltaproteobacteria bacterium]
MSEIKKRVWSAALVLAVLLAPTAAHADRNPFKHPDPRWQIVSTPAYAVLTAYDGVRRRGGGAGLAVLFQLTSGFSLTTEVRWHVFAPRPADGAATQGVGFKLMVRYDLDVLPIRPYLAAGGTAVIFPVGYMRDLEVGEGAPSSAVGANWGPIIEVGLDWRPIPLFAVGIALDMGWLLRFTPPSGKPWPQIRTAGAHCGVYF